MKEIPGYSSFQTGWIFIVPFSGVGKYEQGRFNDKLGVSSRLL